MNRQPIKLVFQNIVRCHFRYCHNYSPSRI